MKGYYHAMRGTKLPDMGMDVDSAMIIQQRESNSASLLSGLKAV